MKNAPTARAQVQLGQAGEVVLAILSVSCSVECGCGLLGDSRCPFKGLAVQCLVASEQGEGEALQGLYSRRPALNSEGTAHGYPRGL